MMIDSSLNDHLTHVSRFDSGELSPESFVESSNTKSHSKHYLADKIASKRPEVPVGLFKQALVGVKAQDKRVSRPTIVPRNSKWNASPSTGSIVKSQSNSNVSELSAKVKTIRDLALPLNAFEEISDIELRKHAETILKKGPYLQKDKYYFINTSAATETDDEKMDFVVEHLHLGDQLLTLGLYKDAFAVHKKAFLLCDRFGFLDIPTSEIDVAPKSELEVNTSNNIKLQLVQDCLISLSKALMSGAVFGSTNPDTLAKRICCFLKENMKSVEASELLSYKKCGGVQM